MSEKKKQLIISISREYGAGGHLIAQILAEKLGLELVDADSIARYFADNHNFNYDEVMKYSGKPFNRIIHRTIQGHTSTLEENLSRMQFDYLRKKAANGDSFVIVGRCSETVLEDYDCMIAFFILADEEDKVKRVMEREGLNEYDARHTARAGTWNHRTSMTPDTPPAPAHGITNLITITTAKVNGAIQDCTTCVSTQAVSVLKRPRISWRIISTNT